MILLHNRDDAKMFTNDVPPYSSESRIQRISNHFKIFKWFVTINVLLLLIFCGYALWSLYQLESALRSREGYLFDRYQMIGSSNGNFNIAELNDSVIISDFNEWRKSILKSLEDLQEEKDDKMDVSYNLKFLLHTIASIVKNFVDNDRTNTSYRNNMIQSPVNSTMLRSKLVTTNLTDFEIHILEEFTKLKILENKVNVRTRIRRTMKNVKDESGCNLQFSFTSTPEIAGRVIVKPVKYNEGMINIKNTINDLRNNKTDVRECSFNIVYVPK